MEKLEGYSLEEIKEIVDMLDNLYNDIEHGREPRPRYDENGAENYDSWYEDAEFIDRYMNFGDAEYCITTDKATNKTYLCEYILVTDKADGVENFYVSQEELYKMVGR